jgi:AbrB family looped-hinge helix DNA binding protein
MIGRLKSLIFGEEDTTETGSIDFMPQTRRDERRPKFAMLKEVNAAGQIYIPADIRECDHMPDVKEGDKFSLDVFVEGYGESGWTNDKREKFVHVTVTKGFRITIPKDTRDYLNIQPGDTIAVHAYSRNSSEN